MEFVEKWEQDDPICINCGAKVYEGWGHDCFYYDCEKCGEFFTNEDVWEIRSLSEKVKKE